MASVGCIVRPEDLRAFTSAVARLRCISAEAGGRVGNYEDPVTSYCQLDQRRRCVAATYLLSGSFSFVSSSPCDLDALCRAP